jgi:hypothetical protein
VRPMLVVVGLVLTQDLPQVGLVPYEGAVHELTAASADPPFGDRVHARRPNVAEHGLDPGAGEDRAECGGEVRSAVADHEPDSMCLAIEIHEQVAGLLGSPCAGRMQGNSEDADSPAGVLDHGQHVSLGTVEQVDGEKVACQDRLGLRAQELGPGWPGSLRRGVDSGLPQDLPDRRCRYLYSQAGQLAVDPAVPPFGVLADQRRTRALMFWRVAGRSCRASLGRPSGGGLCRDASAGSYPG